MNEFYPTPPPEREQPAHLKRKQTHAEYVAAFVPHKEEKIGNFFGKVGACLFFLVVQIVAVALAGPLTLLFFPMVWVWSKINDGKD